MLNVYLWHKADKVIAASDVRVWCKADMKPDAARCPFPIADFFSACKIVATVTYSGIALWSPI